MSLVTRCPACGTMFKVVADQLRVSQGWVRCGSCSDVFDASMHVQNARAPVSSDVSAEAGDGQPSHASASPAAEVMIGAGSASATDIDVSPPASVSVRVDPSIHAVSADAELVALDAQVVANRSDVPVDNVDAGAPSIYPAEGSFVQADFQDVSFVKRARRHAFWQRSVVRTCLGIVASALVMLFGLQWIVQHKDQIANAEPALIPALQVLCQPLKCQVRPLQRIESIVIDSASFTKVDGKSFRLSFVLKNTANAPLEAPMLELTLSDSQDKAVLRRVLSPSQFGVRAGALLAARSETSGLVSLAVGSGDSRESSVSAAMVAGYRVLVFYP